MSLLKGYVADDGFHKSDNAAEANNRTAGKTQQNRGHAPFTCLITSLPAYSSLRFARLDSPSGREPVKELLYRFLERIMLNWVESPERGWSNPPTACQVAITVTSVHIAWYLHSTSTSNCMASPLHGVCQGCQGGDGSISTACIKVFFTMQLRQSMGLLDKVERLMVMHYSHALSHHSALTGTRGLRGWTGHREGNHWRSSLSGTWKESCLIDVNCQKEDEAILQQLVKWPSL